MKRFLCGLSVLIGIMVLSGCGSYSEQSKQNPTTATDPTHPESSETAPAISEDMIEIHGTVVFKEFEGGFYGIEAEGGSAYDPMNLPESYKKDGLKVNVKARPRSDVMGFHMYGSIIEIMDISPR